MATYFLSYSRTDQEFALRFANDLKMQGVDVWVDQINIGVGQNWDREIEAAVRRSKGFIIILSPNSATSENVADELGVAIEGGKHIIPILHRKCTVPMRLARAQFIDATTEYDAALKRCASIILAKSNEVDAAPPLPPASQSGAAADGSPLHLAPASSSPSKPNALPPEMLDKLSSILAVHLGPIARHIVMSEARTATSHNDLCLRLGARISNEKERAKLMQSLLSR
jgi:hypothetical protein